MEFRLEHPTNRQSSTEAVAIISKTNGMYNISNKTDKDIIKDAMERTAMALEEIDNCYEDLLSIGVAKECAANILPMASTTHIHVSGNLRSLLSFLNVRCDHHAQKEIQDIALAMGMLIEEEMPNVMGKLDWRNGMFL